MMDAGTYEGDPGEFSAILGTLTEAQLLAQERDWSRFLAEHLDFTLGERFISGRPLTPTAYLTAREMVEIARHHLAAIERERQGREAVAR
jgi:hypothetical protein